MESEKKKNVLDSSGYSSIILPLDNEHMKHFDCLLTFDVRLLHSKLSSEKKNNMI